MARQEWLGAINNSEILERYRRRRMEINNILRCEKRKHVKCLIYGTEMECRSHKTKDLYQREKNLKGDYKKKRGF